MVKWENKGSDIKLVKMLKGRKSLRFGAGCNEVTEKVGKLIEESDCSGREDEKVLGEG